MDLVFPRDEHQLTSDLAMIQLDKCVFEKGRTTIPYCYVHIIQDCHFHSGAVVYFPASNLIFLSGCTFEEGSVIQSGNITNVQLRGNTLFPSTFAELIHQLNVYRISPHDPLCSLPECEILRIYDGVGWEFDEHSFDGLPSDTKMFYMDENDLHVDPRSLDGIVRVLLRYPRMRIGFVKWDVTKEDDVVKITNHQHRHEISAIFALLRVLPRDLIRHELAPFLI